MKNFLVLLLFFALTSLLYIQTVHSKFVFDFVDLAFELQKEGWSNLGNLSLGFSPYLIAKLAFFVMLKLAGFNPYVWYAVSCALHALNAFLLFRFAEKIFTHFAYKQPFLAAVIGAILFLVSPYHTEAVVWSGALNYLIVSLFILIHLNAVVDFTERQAKLSLTVATLSFAAAVFSHELGLFLLPSTLLLLLLLSKSFKNILNKGNLLLASILLIFTAYYFFNQSLHGSFIGHYGAETHLNFKLAEVVPAFYKYLLKVLFLFTFSPVAVQDKVYAFMQQPFILYFLCFLLILILFFISVITWKNKNRFGVPVLFFVLFCLFVFPVLNLYFPHWIKIHADRYCYLPCAFMYIACTAVLFRWENFMRLVLPAGFILVSTLLLFQINFGWQEAGKLQQQLENDFLWWNAKRVYILNLPDNFRGAYMYRNKQSSAFAGNFVKYGCLIPKTEIIEVLSYNLNAADDSVTIEKVNNNSLKVTLSKWGIWWWRQTKGATDYEDDKVTVDVDDYAHSYLIEFKQKQGEDVFVYQANGRWREVKDF